MPAPVELRILTRADEAAMVEVLTEAFASDALYLTLLGADAALRARLIRFIVTANRLGGGVAVGVVEQASAALPPGSTRERLLGCALVEPPATASVVVRGWRALRLGVRFAPVWLRLGNARVRVLRRLHRRAHTLAPRAPHHYLTMIGVRTDAHGRGLGRALLGAVEAAVRHHPSSTGVALDTENPANVGLYQHWGFSVRGGFELAGMTVSCLFRAVPSASSRGASRRDAAERDAAERDAAEPGTPS